MEAILHNIMLALASAFALALTNYLVAQAKRNGIEIDAAEQKAIRDNAEAAALFAEEKAADYAQRGLAKLTSTDKMRVALAYLRARHPAIDPSRAEDEIHAALPSVGIGATAPDYDPTKSDRRG